MLWRYVRDRVEWLKAELRYRLTGKTYNVVLTDQFREQLSELPEERQKEVLKAIERLKRNPYSGGRIEDE